MGLLVNNVSWLAVGVSTIICFMLGALWYSEKMFGKQWAAGAKVEIAPDSGVSVPALVTQFIGTLLLAWVFAVAAANEGGWAVAWLVVACAAVLVAASTMFGQHDRYATITEGSFVVVMGVVMGIVNLFL